MKIAIIEKYKNSKFNVKKYTNLLPVFSLYGFMSLDLNAAKNSSTGDPEYEWGPVNRIGNPISLKTLIVEELVW